MGAEVTYWVEVEVTRAEWREARGVTSSEALMNAMTDLKIGERLTGIVLYERPDE